ncbi:MULTISPECIES: helix-turn-helix domain-containing protein [unclassified Curtobacterium]|uniref:helix-turn-helix domain-containing protein n=1 Tax=unclassified Curtobacterium TaxID=257496 RepID=UPI000F4B95E0|nr:MULTISPECIES: helix-turn-helix transcriptional regulator [unclassified Curtobacterium]ROP61255.1 helix-turn-helix protein [Curtobacterium sp. ZW137]TCK64632.1 helix-turn-helix protein [Curtobacterium sp. PhB136]
MTDETNPLGEFLRARRELVTPERAGIPVSGVRRVPGLRREEVAMLAGISSEYYLRLEQGRYRNPSAQVLESVARVLQLDEDTTAYLLGLVVEQPRAHRQRRPVREVVPAGLRAFVDRLGTPAFVEGRYLDVLTANPMAAALSPRLVVGANRLRDVFLDPEERALFVDWELATEGLVASFRQSVGTSIDDPRCVELVGQLSIASPRFQRLWGRHDIGGRRGAVMRFDHPVVGALQLHREKLIVAEAQDLTVAIYHADPGTADAEKLALLASTVAV